MRTDSSIKNLIYAFIGQFFGVAISFVSRLVFVKILGSEYLGLNGLFTNILTILSLFELGVGTAINFSLYEPLAKNNIEKIKTLMNLYKKAYTIIGIIILVIGTSITPFLSFFIDNMPNIENIGIIYILFVINTSTSYFFSYKRSLLISDQKRYIATIYRYIFYAALNVFQIIILLLTKNYYLYLIFQIINTLLENIMISIKTNKIYPYIMSKNVKPLDKKTKKQILKNISAMIMHKVGGIAVSATDNIIISKYVGLSDVGIYSNYYLITNALNTIISQIFNSILASIGNFGVTEKNDKLNELFNRIFFINFWIYGFCSICLCILFNDFIKIWLGKEYLFNMAIVNTIVINFYLSGMRKTVLTFKEALGIYWQDRYKAIFEAIVNLIFSIILVKIIGTLGVFIGTLISTVSVCLVVEPYVLYKYGLKTKVTEYFKRYAIYTIIFIITCIVVQLTVMIIPSTANIFIIFILKLLICLIVPNIIFAMLFKNKGEFIYFKMLIIKELKKIKDILKNKIGRGKK